MTNQTVGKDCPDQGVLVDFLQGKLVPPELENCEAHLEDCDICQETLSGINASDTLSEVVAKAMVPSQPATDDAEVVQSLVRRFGDPADFTITRSDISNQELLRDRAAEVLLHVSPDPEDGESLGLLAGFRLRELLGSGGTGVVFRAYDIALDREIALKVLRPSLGDLARDRFVAEARAAASIDHENVVAIYQVGEQDRMAWIAMKWVPGETLESRLTWETSLAEKEVRQIAIQIANGLAEAHRQQLVHRDIKPANVWIGDADGKVLILDFGLVRITDNDPALTATGMLAGTPNFMSPEQAKGQELDARSDLFSLGCVMYQMITGTLPFGSPTILATLQSIQTQQPEPPILFADDCSEELSDLTMALLEKKPANRVDCAESLVRCLETPRSDWPANIKRCVASRRESEGNGRKAAATASQGNRFGAGSLVSAALLGLFGFGLWMFAPQIIRIATNQGELVIETEDEDVTVTVSGDGDIVRVLDTNSGASFDIRSGEFQISAVGKDGKTEFEVKPNKLTMQRGGREVVKVTRMQGDASALLSSATAKEKPSEQEKIDQTQPLYKGKQLSEWLHVLSIDRDPQTQADALKACTAIYLSVGQEEELMALLESFINRNQSISNRKDRDVCLSGFSDSLKNVPARGITEFFKRQLKRGTESSIYWTYKGMTVEANRTARLFSSKLTKELKSDSAEILRLMAVRETKAYNDYLLQMLFRDLLDDPIPDEELNSLKSILAKLSPENLLRIATENEIPDPLFTPDLFASVKTRLFASETLPAERDELMWGLSRFRTRTGLRSKIYLDLYLEVLNNQLYSPDRIEFDKLQEMKVQITRGEHYQLRRDKEGRKISGVAVVVRKLFSDICEQLMKERTESAIKDAEKVAAALSKPSKDNTADPTKLEHFNQLKIDDDLNALVSLATGQSGQFSQFVGNRTRFEGDPNVASVANLKKATTATRGSTSDKSRSKPQSVFEGKQLSEWLQKLKLDRAAKAQAEALKACAALYASSGRHKELMAVLQEYLNRNTANEQLYQGEDQITCFSGFADSLRTLPPEKIVELLKLQLSKGNESTIDWTYRGMTNPTNPPKNLKFWRKIRMPFTGALKEPLRADATELLQLIADRDNCDSLAYLLNFLLARSLKTPVSDKEIEAIRAVMLKLGTDELLKSVEIAPYQALTPDLFGAVKSQLFSADISEARRDSLVERLIKIQKDKYYNSTFLLELFAEVITNQMYGPDRIKFHRLQKQEFSVLSGPDELFVDAVNNFKKRQVLDGPEVVVRKLLTEICEQLTREKATSPEKVAKQVLVILSKPSAGEHLVDPSTLEHFHQLQIDHDVAALSKFSKGQQGTFSKFIDEDDRIFSANPKVTTTPEIKTADSSTPRSDQQETALYKGKPLSEWLKILETDQDSKTQGDAIKACATLYESNGQNDKIVALLKNYVKRHATNKNFAKDADQVAGFLGFGEALEKLPPKMVVEFFKYQLKQGNEITIGWAYLAMLDPRDPRKFSIFTKLKPYSPELDAELKSNAIELLHLIGNREKVDSLDYLVNFIVENLLEDPITDDAITALRKVVLKFEPKELLKVVNKVPKRILDQNLFASVKARLFAADTPAEERDELVESLIKVEKRAKGQASYLLNILADIIANQLSGPDRIEFEELQQMSVFIGKEPSKKSIEYRATGIFIPKGFEKQKISGSAVVTRRLLNTICERLLDRDTSTPAIRAKKFLAILSMQSSKEEATDPSKLEHFNQLKIDHDLDELKKLSEKQSGEFSDFISGKQKF